MLVRNLDACAELASGNIMSGFILVTWYPRRTPPSFPGTLSEIRVHERHILVNLNLERVK